MQFFFLNNNLIVIDGEVKHERGKSSTDLNLKKKKWLQQYKCL